MKRGERRRSYRVYIEDAWARCYSDETAGLYRIEDFSRGGLLLCGRPELPVETPLKVSLHFPSQQPFSIDGTVRRLKRSHKVNPSLAVEFGYLSDDEQDSLSEVVFRQFVKDRSPVVLIGCSRSGEGRALAKTLVEIGYQPKQVSTPLGVIRQLESGGPEVEAVILGSHLGRTEALELAGYLSETHPKIKCILVAKPSWRKRQAAARLVHAIVRKPWTTNGLRNALDAV